MISSAEAVRVLKEPPWRGPEETSPGQPPCLMWRRDGGPEQRMGMSGAHSGSGANVGSKPGHLACCYAFPHPAAACLVNKEQTVLSTCCARLGAQMDGQDGHGPAPKEHIVQQMSSVLLLLCCCPGCWGAVTDAPGPHPSPPP